MHFQANRILAHLVAATQLTNDGKSLRYGCIDTLIQHSLDEQQARRLERRRVCRDMPEEKRNFMSQRKARSPKLSRAESPRRRRHLRPQVTIAVVLLFCVSLAGSILARWRNFYLVNGTSATLVAPVPVPQPFPSSHNPSKEYIYAGSKLIATEETIGDTLPAAPDNFNQVGTSAWFSWMDHSNNETYFKVERSAAQSGPFTLYTTVDANITSCSLGTGYWYRVSAANNAGNSAPSNPAFGYPCPKNSICPDATPPTQYYSLAVNGAGTYVNVPNSSSINVTGPITVEAWVKTNLDGTFFSRVVSRYSETNGGYILDLYHNKVRFWLLQNVSSADYLDGNTKLSPNAWYHIAGVADGQQMRVYLNGLLDGSKNSNWLPVSSPEPLQIGGVVYGGQFSSLFAFNGLIDEVRLSASALYSSNFTPPARLTKDATTRALWKFDDQTVNDSSGNGNNGTLMGGAALSTDVAPVRELVAWANPTTNVTVTVNTLTKIAGSSAAWDGGAASTRALASGDGYLEFTASETTKDRLVGLSTSGAVPNYRAIDFGIRQYYGTLYIIETNGANRQSFGPYVAGDKLRIAIEGGVVRYYRNNTWLYTSGLPPHYPLKVDACLYDPGATINNVVIAGTLTQ